ncbi:MAG TPA: NADP-dependent oxidoreductase [Pyrinomonadaceae bacterium]
MSEQLNRKILLVSRPAGAPALDNFKIEDAETTRPGEGEVLVRALYLSVDPYMRGRMNDRKSYVEPFALNEVIEGGVVGEVVESRAEGFAPGDIVAGMLGWLLYQTAKADPRNPVAIRKVDPRVPITTALGVLGMPGLTAYFGLLDIGRPKEGETVVVSGAAGAVGSIVCQIAKFNNCRVVGVAGSADKCEYLISELGADACVNYKTAGDLNRAMREACPAGVDVYFDNVGGAVSDAVMWLINSRARVVVCGQISMYNSERWEAGPRVQPLLLVKSALMQGFIVSDYAARFGEGLAQLGAWVAAGKLKYAETVAEGFENAPRAFLGLFAGENTGKQLVKVADPSAGS